MRTRPTSSACPRRPGRPGRPGTTPRPTPPALRSAPPARATAIARAAAAPSTRCSTGPARAPPKNATPGAASPRKATPGASTATWSAPPKAPPQQPRPCRPPPRKPTGSARAAKPEKAAKPPTESFPAQALDLDGVFRVAHHQRPLLHRRLQLHAALRQLGQGLRGLGGHAPHLQLVHAADLVLHGLPPHLGGVVKAVHQHLIRLLAGLEHGLFLGLAHLHPHPLVPGEIGQRHIGVVRV